MLKIAIVFPIYNGLSYTQRCLHSLFEVHKINNKAAVFEVVIVDDGSTDGSSEWIKLNFPQVKLEAGNGDLWWSGGINKAITFAINDLNCDFILWWNNDIIAEENYFDHLISLVSESNMNTIIGSKICHEQQRDIIWSMGGLFDTKTGSKALMATAQTDGPQYRKTVECDWLPGMGTITHRSVYEKIGMLDEKRFPQYHGDSDFTLRAKKSGYRIIVHPDLKIYNDTRHSGIWHNNNFRKLIQSLFSIKSNYNIKKDFLFYKKHTESISAYRVLIGKYARYIGGFIKWKILIFFGSKHKRSRI